MQYYSGLVLYGLNRELRRVNKIVKNQNPVKLSFVILRSLKEHTFYDESRIVMKCTALYTLPLLNESERNREKCVTFHDNS